VGVCVRTRARVSACVFFSIHSELLFLFFLLYPLSSVLKTGEHNVLATVSVLSVENANSVVFFRKS
jgi:hypothetical protein